MQHDGEKVVEEFELCGGVISESDRRAVLLRKLPPGVSHSLVSNLRRCGGYREMKAEIREDTMFSKDWGLEQKTGNAHLASEQVPTEIALAAADEPEEDEEGVITFDLSGVSEQQADVLVAAARSPGLRERLLFALPAGSHFRRQR